jgi:hypothetical protein
VYLRNAIKRTESHLEAAMEITTVTIRISRKSLLRGKPARARHENPFLVGPRGANGCCRAHLLRLQVGSVGHQSQWLLVAPGPLSVSKARNVPLAWGELGFIHVGVGQVFNSEQGAAASTPWVILRSRSLLAILLSKRLAILLDSQLPADTIQNRHHEGPRCSAHACPGRRRRCPRQWFRAP